MMKNLFEQRLGARYGLVRLRRYPVLANLDDAQLRQVSQRLLTVPPGRWLLLPGQRLAGSLLLLRGKVRTYAPDGRIAHRSRAARRPLYPGRQGLSTLSWVRLLHLPEAMLTSQADASAESVADDPELWAHRLLGAPLMRRLPPAQWQRLFREWRAEAFSPGDVLMEEGALAEDFLVLKAGQAEVRRQGQVLSALSAGDFCGEDALITDARRNATVTAVSDGIVLRLPKDRFLRLLADQVIRFRSPQTLGETLDLDALHRVSDLRDLASRLDSGKSYRVCGGRRAERALAAFILIQKGFDAWAVDEHLESQGP